MIRALLLSMALLSLMAPRAEAQPNTKNPLDQSEYFGTRLGQNPFCDSKCLPFGNWLFRRDWLESDGGNDDAFVWMVDGNSQYWAERCGQRVNDMIFGLAAVNTFVLQNCKPELIYLFSYTVDVDQGAGKFHEVLRIQNSYEPSDEAWNEFVESIRDNIDPNSLSPNLYTYPTTLLRIIPSTKGADFTKSFNGEVFYSELSIATYERNFCSWRMSPAPIRTTQYCNFNDNYDSDSLELISYRFCEYLFDTSGSDLFNIGCGDSDDDDNTVCDRMFVGFDGDRRRGGEQQHLLKSLMGGLRTQGSMKFETKARVEGEGGAKQERGFPYDQFDPYQQGIDGYPLTHVPFTSASVNPFCGYKYD